MGLEIAVDGPDSQGEATDVYRVTVEDEDYSALASSFTYMVWKSMRSIDLMGFMVMYSTKYVQEHGFPKSINASAIRDLPFVRWESAARAKLTSQVSFGPAGLEDMSRHLVHELGRLPTEDETLQILGDVILRIHHPDLEVDKTPAGKRHYRSLSKLAQTTAEYVWFLQAGRSDPATAIAERHKVSPSTARSWIYRARQVGFMTAAGRSADHGEDTKSAVAEYAKLVEQYAAGGREEAIPAQPAPTEPRRVKRRTALTPPTSLEMVTGLLASDSDLPEEDRLALERDLFNLAHHYWLDRKFDETGAIRPAGWVDSLDEMDAQHRGVVMAAEEDHSPVPQMSPGRRPRSADAAERATT